MPASGLYGQVRGQLPREFRHDFERLAEFCRRAMESLGALPELPCGHANRSCRGFRELLL